MAVDSGLSAIQHKGLPSAAAPAIFSMVNPLKIVMQGLLLFHLQIERSPKNRGMFHLGADDAAPAWCLTEHLNFLVRLCKSCGAAVFGSNVLQSCQLELLSLAQMYCKVARSLAQMYCKVASSVISRTWVLQSCQLELRSLAQMYCKVASSVISRTWVLQSCRLSVDCPRPGWAQEVVQLPHGRRSACPQRCRCPGEPAGPASGESHGPRCP